jgi:hypothetical protein
MELEQRNRRRGRIEQSMGLGREMSIRPRKRWKQAERWKRVKSSGQGSNGIDEQKQDQ